MIGLDMLQAKRSPTQEAPGDTEAAAQKEDAGIVPLGVPMLAGPGAITSVMVLVGQAQTPWQMGRSWPRLRLPGSLLPGAGPLGCGGAGAGRHGDSYSGAHYGAAAGGAGGAVFRQWAGGPGSDCASGGVATAGCSAHRLLAILARAYSPLAISAGNPGAMPQARIARAFSANLTSVEMSGSASHASARIRREKRLATHASARIYVRRDKRLAIHASARIQFGDDCPRAVCWGAKRRLRTWWKKRGPILGGVKTAAIDWADGWIGERDS